MRAAPRRLRRVARRLPVRRLAVAWLLALAVATVLGAAGAQAAAREHACCRNAPVRAEAPPAPCQALLPLACCDATSLPASAPTATAPTGLLALPAPAPALAPAPLARGPADDDALASRASPRRLSVVLRL